MLRTSLRCALTLPRLAPPRPALVRGLQSVNSPTPGSQSRLDIDAMFSSLFPSTPGTEVQGETNRAREFLEATARASSGSVGAFASGGAGSDRLGSGRFGENATDASPSSLTPRVARESRDPPPRRKSLSKLEASQFIDLLSQRVLQAAHEREKEDPSLRGLEQALERKAVYFSAMKREARPRPPAPPVAVRRAQKIYTLADTAELDLLRHTILSHNSVHALLRWTNEVVFGYPPGLSLCPWVLEGRPVASESGATSSLGLKNAGAGSSLNPGLVDHTIYESVILLLFRVLRDKFLQPNLALKLVNVVEHELGPASRLNGCAAALYNEVIQTHWETTMDLRACRDVVLAMRATGVIFNEQTRKIIDQIGLVVMDRRFTSRRHATGGGKPASDRDRRAKAVRYTPPSPQDLLGPQGTFLFTPHDVALYREMLECVEQFWNSTGWNYERGAPLLPAPVPRGRKTQSKHKKPHTSAAGRGRSGAPPSFNPALPNAKRGSNPVLMRFVRDRATRSLDEIRGLDDAMDTEAEPYVARNY